MAKDIHTKKQASSKKKDGKASSHNIAASYNKFKKFEGQQYTGMKIGRSHKWYYDKGEWREKKITPDLWEISYSVTKRRAGKAPEGSGVPVGTEYHWYIISHQNVKKINANDYTTMMSGLKYKLAHKRANKDKWNTTAKTQRKRLIKFLQEFIAQLQQEPVPLQLEYNGKTYKGEAVPIPETCHDGVCPELDITLNDEHLGILHNMKSGWKMDEVPDKKLIDAIGQEVLLWYE
jgi:hypothetical protein